LRARVRARVSARVRARARARVRVRARARVRVARLAERGPAVAPPRLLPQQAHLG